MQFGQDCNIINTLNKFFLGALNLTKYEIWIRLQYDQYVNRLKAVIFNPLSFPFLVPKTLRVDSSTYQPQNSSP